VVTGAAIDQNGRRHREGEDQRDLPYRTTPKSWTRRIPPRQVPSSLLCNGRGAAAKNPAHREWILDRRDHPQSRVSRNQAGNDDNTLSSLASDGSANLRDRKVTSSATRMSGMRGTVGATLLLPLALSAPVGAQDDADLAKKTQNHVADLISVPFENNVKFGVGPRDDVQYILNIQPVIPVGSPTNGTSLAGRSLPYQPELAAGGR
jgi:hypothetical protein